jgi:hypothetical protein
MDLVDGKQFFGWNAHPGGNATAVLGDLLGIVVRADAGVQAAIDALGDAPGAGKKAVADAALGRLFKHGGPDWVRFCLVQHGRLVIAGTGFVKAFSPT